MDRVGKAAALAMTLRMDRKRRVCMRQTKASVWSVIRV
jgi:hypothetical protein